MWRPKLNLRDLFWLIVVVAMGLGWWQTYEALMVEEMKTAGMPYECRKMVIELETEISRLRAENTLLKAKGDK